MESVKASDGALRCGAQDESNAGIATDRTIRCIVRIAALSDINPCSPKKSVRDSNVYGVWREIEMLSVNRAV